MAGMQCSGPVRPALREAAIELVGLLLRVRVDDDQRVQRRPVLVVRLDAAQVRVDERAAGEAAGLHRLVDLRDGGFFDAERRRRRSCCAEQQEP